MSEDEMESGMAPEPEDARSPSDRTVDLWFAEQLAPLLRSRTDYDLAHTATRELKRRLSA
ncbi:MAG: hypothetical protein JWL84_590 [Rhodospirillales bacterium]|nr:hypothetical protein [Rhodospirillales bacterium]